MSHEKIHVGEREFQERLPVPVSQFNQAGQEYFQASNVHSSRIFPGMNPIKFGIMMMRRRKWLALLVFAGCFSSVCIYIFSATPVYRSTVVVEVKQKGTYAVDRGPDEKGDADFARYLATVIGTLKSRVPAEKLVTQMGLDEVPEQMVQRRGIVAWLTGAYSWLSKAIFSKQEAADAVSSHDARVFERAGEFLTHLTILQLIKSNLLEISLDSDDPALAQKMLKNYLDICLEWNLKNRRSESAEAVRWLKEELDRAENKLIESEQALVAFMVKNQVTVGVDGGLSNVTQTMQKKGEGLIRSQESLAKFQALSGRTSVPPGVGTSIGDDPSVRKLKEEFASAEAEKAQMRTIYSDNYPKLIVLSKKMDLLKKKIAEAERAALSSALDAAKKEEALLQSSVANAREEALTVSSLGPEYALLKREVDTNRSLHQIVLQEYKETNIRTRTVRNNLFVIDPPSLPTAPIWPKKRLLLIVGFLVSAVAAIVATIGSSVMDETVQNPDDLEREFNVMGLGVVPDVSGFQGLRLRGSQKEFLAHDYPRSIFADSIRAIHSALLFSLPYQVKSIAISSCSLGEGKTFISMALGSVLAKSGTNKVVVVNCDFRKPEYRGHFQHKVGGSGLAALLNGKRFTPKDAEGNHRIPGLYYIQAGSVPTNHVPLFMTPRFQEIMKELQQHFDFIILDCPPILDFPETRAVCRHADGVVLVARQGYVNWDQLRSGVSAVRSIAETRLLGAILNMAKNDAMGTSFYRREKLTKKYYSQV